MCNKAVLRALVTQRLNAAAEDIFELFERSIAEFEREVFLLYHNNNTQQQGPIPQESHESNTDVPASSVLVKVEPEDEDDPSIHMKLEVEDDRFSVQNPTQTEESREETYDFGEEAAPLTPLDSSGNSDGSEQGDCGEQVAMKRGFVMITPDSRPCSSSGHKPFSCVECGKTFKKKKNIAQHIRRHAGGKTFHCSVCYEGFSEQLALKQHKKLFHRESFNCSVCTDSFPTRKKRNSHMKSHMGKRPFVCTLCNKNFKTQLHLTLHMKIHCEIRPFPCPACEKSFVEQMDLTQHLKQIHHVCPVCSKTFPDKSALRSHLRSHFSCAKCGKRFSCDSALQSHVLVHSEEKPFRCSVCGKSFKRKFNFSKHMKLHRLECLECGFKAEQKRLYDTHLWCSHMICPACKECFTDRDVLIDHVKTHHSGVCPECGIDLKNASLSLHRSRAHLICSVCEEHFADKTSLKGHLNIHINNGTLDPSSGQIIHCEECGNLFFHKAELGRHECDRTLTGHQ